MEVHHASSNQARRTIIVFSVIAVVLIVMGFTLDTGLALRRRTSDISLEDFLILLGALSMLPVMFTLSRLSPERCALQIEGKNVTYKNVGFGWPITKTYQFATTDIKSVSEEGGAVKISFLEGSEHYDADRKEDEPDLEIDAALFGLSPDELVALLNK